MNFQPTKRRDGRHDTTLGEIGRSLKYNTDPLYFHLSLFFLCDIIMSLMNLVLYFSDCVPGNVNFRAFVRGQLHANHINIPTDDISSH